MAKRENTNPKEIHNKDVQHNVCHTSKIEALLTFIILPLNKPGKAPTAENIRPISIAIMVRKHYQILFFYTDSQNTFHLCH
jgi:hypothetical protein